MKLATALLSRRILPKGTPVRLELLKPARIYNQQSLEPMFFKVTQDVKTNEGDMVLIRSQAPATGIQLNGNPEGPTFSRLAQKICGHPEKEVSQLLADNNTPTEFLEAADHSLVALSIQGPQRNFKIDAANPFQEKWARLLADEPSTEYYSLPQGTPFSAKTIEDADIEVEDWLGFAQTIKHS